MLSLWSGPECPYLSEGMFYTCLVPWFLCLGPWCWWLSLRGCPLNAWLWWLVGLVFLNPTRLQQSERVLSSLPHLRPWKAADIRPHSVEYLLILELQPVGYLEVHMSRGLQRCSQGTWTRRYNCSLPLPHDSSPRKEITHSSGASIFVIATQGTTSDCLVWCPTGLTLAVPQDCTYFHTLFRVSFMLHTQRAIAS